MSKNRTNPKKGFCNTGKLPKGPNGRALCRECRKEVPKGRRSFCSDHCVHNWKLRSDPTYVRIKLFERDKGVCAICRADTVRQVRELEKLDADYRDRWARSCYGQMHYKESVAQNNPLQARLKELGISAHRYHGRRRYGIWDADHIVAVSEGGGECGLDNYRTLCCRCHKLETAKLRKRLAKNGGDLPVRRNRKLHEQLALPNL